MSAAIAQSFHLRQGYDATRRRAREVRSRLWLEGCEYFASQQRLLFDQCYT